MNDTVLYDGKLIYRTAANIIALNAYNGATVWSANVLWINGGQDTEPDGDENINAPFLLYNGKIYTSTNDSGGDPSGVPLYGINANNGSLIGISKIFYPVVGFSKLTDPIFYLAIAGGGQLAVTYPQPCSSCSITSNLSLLTNILNASFAANQIWAVSNLAEPPTTNIATYGNVIAMGASTSSYLYSITGSRINLVSEGSNYNQNTGVTSYNGHFIFQGGGSGSTGHVVSISSASNTGANQWVYQVPAAAGTALNNATPVQSMLNTYSMWSNAYVTSVNVSGGTGVQSIHIPYGGNVNPYLVLAYGKLYASVGSHLVAFGTCQADQNSSLLSVLATMYINNQGSCADYLLNSLQSSENTSFTVNNKSIITKASFTGIGTSNIIIPYSSQLAINGNFAVSMWINANIMNTVPAFTTELISTTQPGSKDTFDLQLTGGVGAANPKIQGNIGTGSAWLAKTATMFYNLPQSTNTWYNVIGIFTSKGWTIYVNGNAISANYAGAGIPSLLGTGATQTNIELGGLKPAAGANKKFYTGSISNLQIYNGGLSAAQAIQIYRDGITGPPVSQQNITAWFPLAGDGNGYSPQKFYPGFASNVIFNDTAYNSTAVLNAFSVTSQTAPVLLLNYTTGKFNTYTAGVYSWR